MDTTKESTDVQAALEHPLNGGRGMGVGVYQLLLPHRRVPLTREFHVVSIFSTSPPGGRLAPPRFSTPNPISIPPSI